MWQFYSVLSQLLGLFLSKHISGCLINTVTISSSPFLNLALYTQMQNTGHGRGWKRIFLQDANWQNWVNISENCLYSMKMLNTKRGSILRCFVSNWPMFSFTKIPAIRAMRHIIELLRTKTMKLWRYFLTWTIQMYWATVDQDFLRTFQDFAGNPNAVPLLWQCTCQSSPPLLFTGLWKLKENEKRKCGEEWWSGV